MDVNGCHGFRIHRMHPIYPNMASLSRAQGCSNHPLHRWPFSSAEILSWKIRPPNLFQTVVKSQPETVVISNVSLLWVFQLLNVTKLISWYIMIYHDISCMYLSDLYDWKDISDWNISGISWNQIPIRPGSRFLGLIWSADFSALSAWLQRWVWCTSPKKIWCKNCNW